MIVIVWIGVLMGLRVNNVIQDFHLGFQLFGEKRKWRGTTEVCFRDNIEMRRSYANSESTATGSIYSVSCRRRKLLLLLIVVG